MSKRFFLVLFGAAMSAVLWADIAPVPGTQAIRPLFDAATLVCDCSVRSVELLGPKNATGDDSAAKPRSVIAVVEVEDVYKASGSEPISATIQCEEGQLWKGEKGIFFLKSTAPSVYELADRFVGATPFSSIPRGTGAPGFPKLESTLAVLTQSSNHDDQMNAMKLLQGFDSLDATTIELLIPLSNSRNPEIALSALAVLLKTKRPEDVERVWKYLADYQSDSAPIAVVTIGTELSQIQDERALRYLEALSGSNLISVRMGSMQALRAMKNPKSGRTLIARLNDSNGYVRYLAVISLAETFGKYGDYAPNMELFDGNPEFYVGLWRAWWTQEGGVSEPRSAAQ